MQNFKRVFGGKGGGGADKPKADAAGERSGRASATGPAANYLAPADDRRGST
jgi:hypothetical protein